MIYEALDYDGFVEKPELVIRYSGRGRANPPIEYVLVGRIQRLERRLPHIFEQGSRPAIPRQSHT